jgi:hypothetical protein
LLEQLRFNAIRRCERVKLSQRFVEGRFNYRLESLPAGLEGRRYPVLWLAAAPIR